jgi:hypothetical protein
VTLDHIQRFSDQYKGSTEEEEHVLSGTRLALPQYNSRTVRSAYLEGNGDMQFVCDNVMLADTDEDEERFRGIIDAAIADGRVQKLALYKGKRKRSKKEKQIRAKVSHSLLSHSCLHVWCRKPKRRRRCYEVSKRKKTRVMAVKRVRVSRMVELMNEFDVALRQGRLVGDDPKQAERKGNGFV